MSSSYMRIEGLDKIPGSGTVEVNGKKGFMPINEATFNMHRAMQIKTGATTNADIAPPFISPMTIHRDADGATPFLITAFFEHKAEANTIEIIATKFSREGTGLIPAFVTTLEGARLSSYGVNVAAVNGAEQYTIVCTTLSIVHYTEDEKGKVEKGQTVKFDVTEGKLLSKAK